MMRQYIGQLQPLRIGVENPFRQLAKEARSVGCGEDDSIGGGTRKCVCCQRNLVEVVCAGNLKD